MSDSKIELLRDILRFFNMMGVIPDKGEDGKLMSRIAAEVDGTAPIRPVIQMPRGRCPCCGAPDLMSCDCDPDAQLKAWEARQQQ
jgi:hypothetical protein